MIERKVQASTGAAAVSGLALWMLGHYVFRSGVPDVVASWVFVLVPGVITFAAGYFARHTNRPAVTAMITAGGPAAEQELQKLRDELARVLEVGEAGHPAGNVIPPPVATVVPPPVPPTA